MLRVKIELVPFGDEKSKSVIQELLIANTTFKGHIDPNSYVYDCYLAADDYTDRSSRVATIEHPQEYGAWDLVAKALAALKQDNWTAEYNKSHATATQRALAKRCGETLESND